MGRHDDARAALTSAAEAAEKLGDTDLRARIAGTTGYLIAQHSSAAEGERVCLEALALPGLSDESIAILHGQLGSIDMDRGRHESAERWLSKAIDGLAGSPVRAAHMRMNRSIVEMSRGRLEEAESDVLEAERIYREAGLVLDADQAAHNRGYLRMLAGDLVSALKIMQSVRGSLGDTSETSAAIGELDRAEVLREAGLTTEAERSLEKVAQVFGRLGITQDRAEAEYQLARSLLSHAPSRAARVSAAARRRFRSLGADGWAARAAALGLRARLAVQTIDRSGVAAQRPGRLPSASEVEDLATTLESLGHRNDAIVLRLTHLLARLRTGVDPRSIRAPRLPRTASLEAALLADEVRAERASRLDREVEARRYAARAIERLEGAERSGGSLELTASSSLQGNGPLSVGLASAVRSGRPEIMFEWSERARHVTQAILPVRPPHDPELAAELAELRVLRAEQSDGEWLGEGRPARLRDSIRERQWSRVGGGPERVGLDEVRGVLGPHEAVISFVFDGRGLSSVVATASSRAIVALDWEGVRAALRGLRADLDMSASMVAGALAGVVRGALDGRLARLSHLLLAPTLAAAGDVDRVVITTPGVLAGIPWMMLPASAGRAITLAPSASFWARRRFAPADPPSSAGFVVGPRVARGDEETDAAARAWSRARTLRGRAADAASVTDLAAGVDVLHVAAHGHHAVDNPMFSGLELADGTLFGYDIDLIPRIPDTVVLSACEVGRSSVRWGEEAIGMTRIWLHAGTRCVIAAPVVVADDIACELLGAMHEGLAAGVPPAVALAEASARTGLIAPFQAHGAGF
nr:CHAT domain-containing protein [Microbacterium immunditiarum]